MVRAITCLYRRKKKKNREEKYIHNFLVGFHKSWQPELLRATKSFLTSNSFSTVNLFLICD